MNAGNGGSWDLATAPGAGGAAALPGPVIAAGRRAGRGTGWAGSTLRLFLTCAEQFRAGTLTVVLPDGAEHRYGGAGPGPAAVLRLHDARVARRFLLGGALGFCEAYLDGDWSSPDLETLFTFFLLNQEPLRAAMHGKTWVRAIERAARVLQRNTRRGAQRNIACHYDLGNAFYAHWLDESMTYSAALFDRPGQDLAAAQRRKYEVLAERMDLVPGQHVLEIGCGWGGFAEFLAAERGVRVTAITISRAQYSYARRRIAQAGLADRVEIRLQDYRDVAGGYDRIAAIEMVEAVGERYWPHFFSVLRDRLAPGGVAALQVITIADRDFAAYRRGNDYIRKYIFPGGMLPSPAVLRQQVQQAGLQLCDMAGFGPDYARTLRLWHRRFQAAWPAIQRMGFNGRFKRMWEQYLQYCAAGFRAGRLDVVQMALRKTL